MLSMSTFISGIHSNPKELSGNQLSSGSHVTDSDTPRAHRVRRRQIDAHILSILISFRSHQLDSLQFIYPTVTTADMFPAYISPSLSLSSPFSLQNSRWNYRKTETTNEIVDAVSLHACVRLRWRHTMNECVLRAKVLIFPYVFGSVD